MEHTLYDNRIIDISPTIEKGDMPIKLKNYARNHKKLKDYVFRSKTF